jgi:hypothetical protein
MMRDITGHTHLDIINDGRAALTEAFRSVNEVDGHQVSLSPISGESLDAAQVISELAYTYLDSEYSRTVAYHQANTAKALHPRKHPTTEETTMTYCQAAMDTCMHIAAACGFSFSFRVCCDRMKEAVFHYRERTVKAD